MTYFRDITLSAFSSADLTARYSPEGLLRDARGISHCSRRGAQTSPLFARANNIKVLRREKISNIKSLLIYSFADIYEGSAIAAREALLNALFAVSFSPRTLSTVCRHYDSISRLSQRPLAFIYSHFLFCFDDTVIFQENCKRKNEKVFDGGVLYEYKFL